MSEEKKPANKPPEPTSVVGSLHDQLEIEVSEKPEETEPPATKKKAEPAVKKPDGPANVSGRLDRELIAVGVGNALISGKVINDWGKELQLQLHRGTSTVPVRYTVKESAIVSIIRKDEAMPKVFSRQERDLVVRPHVDGQGGEAVTVLACRIANKPGRGDTKAAEAMFKGEDIVLKMENRHPACFIELVLRSVVDKRSVVDWMSRDTSLTCNAPFITENLEDPSIRVFADDNWDPFRIAFTGTWSCETIS